MWQQTAPKEPQVTPPSPVPEGAGALWFLVKEDVEAVQKNDPAARSVLEVFTSYPGLHALWLHRVAHDLWKKGQTTTARLLSNFNRFFTGVEIHPGATVGRRVFIDHGMGVVIGETAIIGDECLIYKGVLLGGTSLNPGKRHPTVGKGVVLGSNACILGNIRVGDEAKIGSGSVVVRDVPDGCTAVGVPGKIVSTTSNRAPLDHGDLPDPVATLMRSLLDEVDGLKERLAVLEEEKAAEECRKAAEEQGVEHDCHAPSRAEREEEERRRTEEFSAVFFEDISE